MIYKLGDAHIKNIYAICETPCTSRVKVGSTVEQHTNQNKKEDWEHNKGTYVANSIVRVPPHLELGHIHIDASRVSMEIYGCVSHSTSFVYLSL